MIERREFGKTLVSGMVGTATVTNLAIAADTEPRARPAKKNLLMHVGADYHSVAGGPRSRYDRKGKPGIQLTARRQASHRAGPRRVG
jgi:hypothetical protein